MVKGKNKCRLTPHQRRGALLTVDGRDDDGPHECRMLGVGAFPVQGDAAGADFSCAAVDGVEGVSRADGVHHCPIFTIVRVHR